MAGEYQKEKLILMSRYFHEHTDDEHGVTVKEIIEFLNSYDILADRKTIYSDIEALRHSGLDIVSEKKGKNVYYSLAAREFELAEVKLLVDSVQAAKFISESKSRTLIKKLESLVSKYEAKQLSRQVIISGRVKAQNETVLYSVDSIHAAISNDVQIEFQYFQWNTKKEPELRHGGQWYHVSPWALLWDDEYYYMVGFDNESGKIKHYRVDKMLRITLTEEKREGREVFNEMNIPEYSKGLFGMFTGEEMPVTLLCTNDMVAAIIDRFGTEVPVVKVDDEHCRVTVTVTSSVQFIGWVVGLGKGVRIEKPQALVDQMKETVQRLSEQYI